MLKDKIKEGTFQKADILNAFRESLGQDISIDRERFVSAFEKKVPIQNLDNADANSS